MIMRRIMILLILLAVLIAFAACDTSSQVSEETVQPEVTDEAEATPEPTDEAATPEPTDSAVKTVTDMVGREVSVPAEVEKVFGTNNTSSILLYTLAPEKMIGWNNQMGDDALALIAGDYAALPILGNLYGSGKEASVEEVLALEPDVVLITDTKKKESLTEDADALQEKLGVPVVVIVANMNNYDKAYTFLGEVLGAEARAETLSAYYTETMAYAAEKSAMVEEPVSIYYARMDNGLTTEFAGSPNAKLIELVGGTNIAVSDTNESSAEVSIEQVMTWNPEVILIGHIGQSESKAYDVIMSDDSWAQIDAVQTGNVISTPRLPFNWFDRPPSVNRLIGLKWLGNKLYPDVFDCDMVEETKEFYQLFYGVELSDEEATELIG